MRGMACAVANRATYGGGGMACAAANRATYGGGGGWHVLLLTVRRTAAVAVGTVGAVLFDV